MGNRRPHMGRPHQIPPQRQLQHLRNRQLPHPLRSTHARHQGRLQILRGFGRFRSSGGKSKPTSPPPAPRSSSSSPSPTGSTPATPPPPKSSASASLTSSPISSAMARGPPPCLSGKPTHPRTNLPTPPIPPRHPSNSRLPAKSGNPIPRQPLPPPHHFHCRSRPPEVWPPIAFSLAHWTIRLLIPSCSRGLATYRPPILNLTLRRSPLPGPPEVWPSERSASSSHRDDGLMPVVKLGTSDTTGKRTKSNRTSAGVPPGTR